MRYSLEDIHRAIDPGVLRRGQALVQAPGAIRVNVAAAGAVLTAQIATTDGPVRVYARVEHDAGTGVGFKVECSCAQSGGCEHAAAMLLAALDAEQSPAPVALPGSARDRGGRRLLYVLCPSTTLVAGLQLRLFVAQTRAEDGCAEVHEFIPAIRQHGVAPAFLSADDVAIIAHLLQSRAGDRDPLCLREGGPLRQMLASGRCHLHDPAGSAVRPGAPRQASLNWEIGPCGDQLAHWHLPTPAAGIFVLDTLWYLDSASAECGPLETDLPAALAVRLSVAPPLAPDAVEPLCRQLVAQAGTAVALPERLAVDDLPALAPIPRLGFERHDHPNGPPHDPVDLICLDFSYHGHVLHRTDRASWMVARRVVRVQRDRVFEHTCVEQLRRLGLSRDVGWSERLGRDCFAPLARIDAWRVWQLEQLPRLREQGWQVSYQQGSRRRVASVSDWCLVLDRAPSLEGFELGVSVTSEDGDIDLLPVLVEMIRAAPPGFLAAHLAQPIGRQVIWVELDDGRELALPVARLRPILETLFELYEPRSLSRNGRLRMTRIQLARLAELPVDDASWAVDGTAGSALWHTRERLCGGVGMPRVDPPQGLRLDLREYQRQGLDWLQFLAANELAGILADDMGLGKTVQALAHLLLEKEHGRLTGPALVIAPTSLMANWRNEARQYAPALSVLVLQGPDRAARFARIPEHDVILTTYPLLARDHEQLLAHRYHLLILDEAQLIKNSRTRAARLVRHIDARHRLCLSGTPMENHLGELWSLFDFLLPGLLGTERQFRRHFRDPIERQGDARIAQLLAQRLRPVMLRRTKAEVAAELPPRSEIVHAVELDGTQRELYESIRVATHAEVRRAVAEKGLPGSRLLVIDALLKLRQVCCDPRLVKLSHARQVTASAKLAVLMEMLPEMVAEGRRILLFSQFTAMLDLIKQALHGSGLNYVELTGDTRDRATPVARFQAGEVPLFLISLKAGGVGLNLTAADTVIHYDPWWNPAVERQATDRAHRIGQRKPVFVYKLITAGTVEERIQQMQVHKQSLVDRLYAAQVADTPWTEADLDALFAPLIDCDR